MYTKAIGELCRGEGNVVGEGVVFVLGNPDQHNVFYFVLVI